MHTGPGPQHSGPQHAGPGGAPVRCDIKFDFLSIRNKSLQFFLKMNSKFFKTGAAGKASGSLMGHRAAGILLLFLLIIVKFF